MSSTLVVLQFGKRLSDDRCIRTHAHFHVHLHRCGDVPAVGTLNVNGSQERAYSVVMDVKDEWPSYHRGVVPLDSWTLHDTSWHPCTHATAGKGARLVQVVVCRYSPIDLTTTMPPECSR